MRTQPRSAPVAKEMTLTRSENERLRAEVMKDLSAFPPATLLFLGIHSESGGERQ